jgi:hypothetical protein
MYTLQKLKKLMACERPEGRRLRTGFTVPEVCAIFTRALKAIDAESDPAQRAQLVNLTAALGFTYEVRQA